MVWFKLTAAPPRSQHEAHAGLRSLLQQRYFSFYKVLQHSQHGLLAKNGISEALRLISNMIAGELFGAFASAGVSSLLRTLDRHLLLTSRQGGL